MFIILNAIIASLDGLIIGISLHLSKTKITLKNNIIFLITNFLIYTLVNYLYIFFHFTFMTKTITTFLYLFLAWNAYKTNDEEEICIHDLTFKKNILLAFTHSLDGSIISLNFINQYNLILIIGLFSFSSLLLLLIGYYFANILKNIKKSNLISALLFILLAILNQFF